MPDPYLNFKYSVEIGGFSRTGFRNIDGLKQSLEEILYREGGENETAHKIPGQTTYDDVTFERGQSSDTDFTDWLEQIFDVDRVDGAQGDVAGWRKTIVIYLHNKAGVAVVKWTLKKCWPSELAWGTLDAMANDVMIETLVVKTEGIKAVKL